MKAFVINQMKTGSWWDYGTPDALSDFTDFLWYHTIKRGVCNPLLPAIDGVLIEALLDGVLYDE